MAFPGMQTRPGASGQDEYAGLDPQQAAIVKMVRGNTPTLSVRSWLMKTFADAIRHGILRGEVSNGWRCGFCSRRRIRPLHVLSRDASPPQRLRSN